MIVLDPEIIKIFEWGYFFAEKFGLLWILQAIIVVRLVMAFSRYFLNMKNDS